MHNIMYLIFIFLGFVLPFLSCLIINKKLKIVSLEYLFYSFILFLIFFLLFSKIFHVILECDINSLIVFIKSNFIIDKLKFILSGYSFIGGYIGSIIVVFIFSKIIKNKDLLIIYFPNFNLMYGILKIGCHIKGCCGSFLDVPIQLIESVLNIIIYLLIIKNINKISKNKIIGISLISFGIIRFIISLFRLYNYFYSFILIQLFCLLLIIIGIKTILNKKIAI